jgi:hypothetical protein
MKEKFLVQPYLVGSSKSKSLAIVIPSEIVKRYHIDDSTGFILKFDEAGLRLQYVDKNV